MPGRADDRPYVDDMDALPAYIINMDSQPGRWRIASSQLQDFGLEHQRFPAVNGATISQSDAERYVDWEATRRWKFNITPPEIGCFLSHMSLIGQISQDGHEGAFIFEDDFGASDELPAVMEVLSEIGFGRPVIVRLDSPSHQLAFPVYRRALAGTIKLLVPLRIPPHTTAYYINRVAAQVLTEKCQRFYMPIDCQFRHHWQMGIDVLMVSPAKPL